ncbi:alternative oxidase [Marinobacter halophilus]|uniref:alternative oxidase n=1 Tax=Marinobacter halophilus TaxID=1323740 RepID=UPI0024345BD4|nr:alternative oxidase [Marinobacter halophilus]
MDEEAVFSHTKYLERVDSGKNENVTSPQIATDYWQLPQDARLSDVIIGGRADEAKHRDANHVLPIS